MRTLLLALPLAVLAQTAPAGPISFGGTWNEQRLQIFNSNTYSFNGSSMNIASDGGVSLAWTRTARGDWGARAASWNWGVSQSVPPTDLGRKGGDDRNISIYFVFLPEASYCQIWCLRVVGHAAIWSGFVVSIPSLNVTPVMTFAR